MSLLSAELRQIVAEIVAWGFEALQVAGHIFMNLEDIGIEVSDYHLVKTFV